MQHRPSSVPLFEECPSSALKPKHRIDSSSQPATDGTAVHEANALMVLGQEPDLPAIGLKYDVDQTTLRVLYAYGKQAWGDIKQYFPEPKTEMRVESPMFRGTADVLSANGSTLNVLDWKSGYIKTHALGQLMAYAHAAVHTYGWPKSGVVTAFIVWLRFNETIVKHLKPDDLKAFEGTIHAQEEGIGKIYSPGEHCVYCNVAHECGALAEYSRNAGSSIVKINEEVSITPERLASLYSRSRVIGKALDAYDKMLKLAVAQAGKLSLPDGGYLKFQESAKQKLDVKKSWPVLKQLGFSSSDMASAATLSKTKVLNIISERTEKGKGKAKVAALEALVEAGAVSEKLIRKLTAVKK